MTAFIILALLNLVDIAITDWALHNGHQEANPLVRWLMGRIGNIPAMVLAKAPLLIGCYLISPHPAVWVAVVAYAGLMVWNLRVIGK